MYCYKKKVKEKKNKIKYFEVIKRSEILST